jgi:hypothetical protein
VAGIVVIIAAIAAWRPPDGFKGASARSGAGKHLPTLAATASAPPAFQVMSAPASMASRPSPARSRQNEFGADDAVVLSAADDHTVQDSASNSGREFAQSYRGLALRFSGETSTEAGARLQATVMNRISEQQGATPFAVQMECRQTICRLQLTGPENSDRSKAMEDVTGPGEFRQFVGMDRPSGGNATTSDVYLVMK